MPDSKAQVGLAGAVASGKSKAMPKDAAMEILHKMRSKKMSSLPDKVRGRDKEGKGKSKSKAKSGKGKFPFRK